MKAITHKALSSTCWSTYLEVVITDRQSTVLGKLLVCLMEQKGQGLTTRSWEERPILSGSGLFLGSVGWAGCIAMWRTMA